MMGRGHKLNDIVYTLGTSAAWATFEWRKIEKAFPQQVFIKAKNGHMSLTAYGKMLSNICNKFLAELTPNLGDVKTKP